MRNSPKGSLSMRVAYLQPSQNDLGKMFSLNQKQTSLTHTHTCKPGHITWVPCRLFTRLSCPPLAIDSPKQTDPTFLFHPVRFINPSWDERSCTGNKRSVHRDRNISLPKNINIKMCVLRQKLKNLKWLFLKKQKNFYLSKSFYDQKDDGTRACDKHWDV